MRRSQKPITESLQSDMSTVENRPIIARETRYQFAQNRETSVRICRQADTNGQSIDGTLLDLSRGGAKLSLARCIAIQEVIELEIELVDANVCLTLQAEVRWLRPQKQNMWSIGVAFCERLSDEQLALLAGGGYLERREGTRYGSNIPATIRRELSEETIPVEVVNISVAGIGLSSAEPIEIGQHVQLRLLVEAYSDKILTATTRWIVRVDDHYHIGCMLHRSEDHRHLKCAAFGFEIEKFSTAPKARVPWLRLVAVALFSFCTTFAVLATARPPVN